MAGIIGALLALMAVTSAAPRSHAVLPPSFQTIQHMIDEVHGLVWLADNIFVPQFAANDLKARPSQDGIGLCNLDAEVTAPSGVELVAICNNTVRVYPTRWLGIWIADARKRIRGHHLIQHALRHDIQFHDLDLQRLIRLDHVGPKESDRCEIIDVGAPCVLWVWRRPRHQQADAAMHDGCRALSNIRDVQVDREKERAPLRNLAHFNVKDWTIPTNKIALSNSHRFDRQQRGEAAEQKSRYEPNGLGDAREILQASILSRFLRSVGRPPLLAQIGVIVALGFLAAGLIVRAVWSLPRRWGLFALLLASGLLTACASIVLGVHWAASYGP